jgi:hypothetical protein
MSDIDSVLNRLRRAYAAIDDVERAAKGHPGDRFVIANLQSLQSHASLLEQQWEDECRFTQREICRYRIIPQSLDRYSIAHVSKSLLDFQELFSQIYDVIKTGVRKQRARVGPDIAAETQFDFGFTYPGSLGVALMVDSESQLFGENKFDQTVAAISDIIGIDDDDDVRDLARNLGGAVVTKVFDWSKVNFVAGYGLDITWQRTNGTMRGGVIDAQALGKVVEIIQRTSDRSTREIEIRGVLIGIDKKTKRFRFVEHDGPDYVGNLPDTFPLEQQWSINTNYIAKIQAVQVTKYATMEEETSFELFSLNLSGTA